MLTIKALAGGETYAAHHLSNNDYYSVGETITGRWMGRGAELLGLEGEVTIEQFDAIRRGVDPFTDEFLRARQNVDRYGLVERNGEKKVEKIASARNLYDFTVSAPKALSVQALEDPRLIEVHKEAVTEMAAEMERLASVGVRKLGANDARVTSNLVIARYEHDTSRELDPQLHTHLVAGNLSYDGAEGKWKVLRALDLYQRREYLTEVYRNAAARGVTNLGYQIEDRFEKGKDNGFGIVGIKESTLEKYSQRSAQRDAAIADFMAKNGRRPSNNEIALLVRDSRPEKLTEISTAEVKAGQRSRMSPEEAEMLQDLRQVALQRGSIREQADAAISLTYAAEHTFERVSVARDYELKTEALRHGRGRIELTELKAALASEVARGAMLTARGEVTTRESLARERLMKAAINDGIGCYQPLGRSREFVASVRLRPEQKKAVLAALASRDLAFNIQGAAGTGKTDLLRDLQRGLSEARRSVMAVGPSTSSVDELKKVGFSEAITIARLLIDPVRREQLAGQVLILDEAGMVGSKDMAELVKLAKSKDARIVFSGDTAQIKSVSEGDALRVLERESNLQTVSLREVFRQTNAEYKVAVEALRADPAEGYERLEKMGAVREVDWRLVGTETSRAYREAAAIPNAKGEKRSVLVVARTHDQIQSITHAIRQDRKSTGEISEGEVLVRHSALNWTEAQKSRLKRYQPGQVLRFHKAVKGVAKNEALEVVTADKNGVRARKENGQEVKVTGKHAKAFGVFERENIEVSAGDRLLLQANYKAKKFRATNGELVTVASVERGTIKLEDGREFPASYKQFTSGYAVTAHASQGKSVDWVIAAPDGMRKDLAYVAWTRGREGLTIVTSDKAALAESISVSGDRTSATELAKHAEGKRTAQDIAADECQLYQQFQQHQEPAPQRVRVKQEVSRDVSIHHDTGIGIGF